MSEDEKQGRISKGELVAILECASERDKVLLESLSAYRFLLTGQIQRLHFTQASSERAALRATSRCLKKLEELGLTTTLKRRIGGVRSGSSSYVWTLTPTGYRLLDLLANTSCETGRKTRKRSHEPSAAFLQHTLAVAEIAIRLTELATKQKIELLMCQSEPDCWRSHTGAGGVASTLRPDLFAITAARKSEYEDHWFIEVDMATESPAVVVRKCQQYLAYLNSGEEQKRSGVFPLIVWIVPDDKRKGSLLAHIAASLTDNKDLFVAITFGQIEQLLLAGATNE